MIIIAIIYVLVGLSIVISNVYPDWNTICRWRALNKGVTQRKATISVVIISAGMVLIWPFIIVYWVYDSILS